MQIRKDDLRRTEREIDFDASVKDFREAFLDAEIQHRNKFSCGGEISAWDVYAKKWIQLQGWMSYGSDFEKSGGLGVPVLFDIPPKKPLTLEECAILQKAVQKWIKQAEGIAFMAGAIKWKIDDNH